MKTGVDDVSRDARLQESGGVSYRESEGSVVAILVCGLGLTSRFYEHSFAAFAAAGVRLIVPDLPGYGRTRGNVTGDHPRDTADRLIEFCDSIGVHEAVWIGHSLGAQVVAQLAANRPALARGVVLAGPVGAPGGLRRLGQMWGLTREAKRAGARVIAAVVRDYIRASPLRYIGTWLKHSDEQLLDVLPRVLCPALILAGDSDPLCRAEYVSLIEHRLSAARVCIVRGGTHALPRGNVDEFNRAVISFVLSL